jgi:hypothetical protein
MSTKIANLQSALNSSTGRSAPVAVAPAAAPTVIKTGKPPSRAEQVNISAWLHKDFKKSIRLVQARKVDKATLQDLMAEAFNDLFSKYNVPTITEE